ncbi:molybdate ABC transporter substrate-binding protein [Polynucleobacter sp. AM-26B4]|jgi:molybdate transport system substrate-binding protein|uniref:molybdate ABC transporter substrate-binding protein n=1 Tax=Polynucleobacter sp. AM-26B4 TaxID=2689103 RepID=UPI00210603C7|nr:molybdate ABC transporter substrate-binding protein [Polynucleobacter sp. AM-26B4]
MLVITKVTSWSFAKLRVTMKLKRFFLSKTLLSVVTVFFATLVNAQQATVVVAANMKPAMEEIYRQYKMAGGQDLRIIYGSSGNFARQIQQGAPFNLFVSADESFPIALHHQGLTVDEGKVYAIGRLALIAHKSRKIKLSLNPVELKKIIEDTNKIAIAKPDTAPYGKAATDFLNALGLYESAKNKIVFGENISSATMFVTSGSAGIGLTAYSLAKSKEVLQLADHLLIPNNFHEPIKQRMVLLKNPPRSVVDFYAYLQSPKAKDVFRLHGYSSL